MSRDARGMAGGARSVRAAALRRIPHYAPGVGGTRPHAPDDRQVRRGRSRRRQYRGRGRAEAGARAESRPVGGRERARAPRGRPRACRGIDGRGSLRRARERGADPELFAGLSPRLPVLRPDAGVARGRRAGASARSPHPRQRALTRYFMLGDYERVLEYEPRAFHTCAIWRWSCWAGSTKPGVRDLEAVDTSVPSRLVVYVKVYAPPLDGTSADGCLRTSRRLTHDPRSGRPLLPGAQLAYLGERTTERWTLLGRSSRTDSSACLRSPATPGSTRSAARRSSPRIVRRVEARHRQALISFLTAEGDRVLGIAHPV